MAAGFLPPVVATLLADISEFKAGMREARAEMGETEGSGKSLSSMMTLGIAAAVGAVGYEAIKMGSQFQSVMETLHTQAGVPQAALASLSQGVLQLAGQVGFAPDSLAEALYHIESSFASVGITGPKALQLLQIAAEGAATGHADLVDVTNALDAAVASGIPGVQNFSQAMGVLNATVGAGDMTMQDLAGAFSTGLLANVKSYGLSITDVGAALAVFGDNNIRGQNAATELRMAVQAMAVPAKTAAADLQKMGLSSQSLGQIMSKQGLLPALETLKQRMTAMGVTATTQGQVLTDLFGKKAGAGIVVLYDQLDRLKSKYPDLSKGAKGFGDAWTSTKATFSQTMKQVGATFDSLITQLGMKLMPILTKIADWFLGSVSWLEHHKAVVEAIAVVIGGALVYGLYAAAAAAIAFVAALEIDPIFLIIEAIVAAVYLIITHWTQIKHFFADLWKWMKQAAGDVAHFFEHMWDNVAGWATRTWGTIVTALKTVWSGIKAAWDATGGAAISWIKQAWDKLTAPIIREWDKITSDLSSIWQSLTQIWNATGGKLVHLISDNLSTIWQTFMVVWDLIVGLVKAYWDLLVSFISGYLDIVKGIFKAGWDVVLGIFHMAWDLISGLVRAAWSVISGLIRAQMSVITGILRAAWDLLVGAVKIAWDIVTGIFNTALDTIKGLLKFFADLVTGRWGKLWGDVKSAVGTAWKDISGIFTKVLGQIKTSVIGAVKNIWSGFTGAISDAVGGITGALKDVWTAIVNFFKDAATWLVQAGKDVINGLVNGVKSMVGGAISSVKSVVGSVVSSVTSFLGISSPSKVFHQIGRHIGEGLVNGITSMHQAAAYASAGLAGAVTDSFRTGPLGINVGGSGGSVGAGFGVGAAGMGTSGGGFTVEVYLDGQKVQGAVRKQTLRYDQRNSSNGLALRGRG